MKKTVIVCDEKDWKFFREDEQGNRTEMKPKRKKVKCAVCGNPINYYEEYRMYDQCPCCGWRCGGNDAEMEKQWGISCPMLVSLSHAKEQYKKGVPFKADFDEFVKGLLFYSEMLVDYQGVTYEAYLYRDKEVEPYKFVFCCADFQQEYFSEKDFREKANIQGKCLKDLWDEVQDPRYM